MKKLMWLVLVVGFVSPNAKAEVGIDKSTPNCQQVIQSIQDTLKNRPSGAEAPVNGETPPAGSTTAQ